MNSSNAIRILTVDDHVTFREGIAAVLRNEKDLVLVAEATNGREAIDQFRAYRPDVVLMDLQMPIMDGNDAIRAIRNEFPSARIIAMTTYRGDARAVRAFEAGAAAYLLKGEVRKELVETIRSVHAGQKNISLEMGAQLLEDPTDDALDGDNVEVLSQPPLASYLKSILCRLGAGNRAHESRRSLS